MNLPDLDPSKDERPTFMELIPTTINRLVPTTRDSKKQKYSSSSSSKDLVIVKTKVLNTDNTSRCCCHETLAEHRRQSSSLGHALNSENIMAASLIFKKKIVESRILSSTRSIFFGEDFGKQGQQSRKVIRVEGGRVQVRDWEMN